MSEGKSLKEQNAWLIRAVLMIHAIAFAWVAFEPFPLAQFSELGLLQKAQGLLAPGSISLGLIALARLVLLGMIPANLRNRLVLWRWRHPLPGSRAFTKIGPADARVHMEKLKKSYGPLPDDPGHQSRLFYSIYKVHSKEIGVLDAHRSYLAARDIATINLILLFPLSVLAWWASHDFLRAAVYGAALLLSYLVMCVAAQMYGVRLVENVLAVASSGQHSSRKK